MALVALTTDQKEQLKASSKFNAMIRNGAYLKANFWINTVDPGTPTSLPGNVGTTAAYIRWAKSRCYAVQISSNPINAENDANFVALFLQNLTIAVWDNTAIPVFNADSIIVDMEINRVAAIDSAIDLTFDAKIKYSNF